MKKRLLLASLSLALSACTTAAISREGYRLPETKSTKPCPPVAVQFQGDVSKLDHEYLGRIYASEPGMGIDCRQDQVFRIFLDDACAIGADLILIVQESYPDVFSTCYRAQADMIRLKKKVPLKSSPQYAENLARAGSLPPGRSTPGP